MKENPIFNWHDEVIFPAWDSFWLWNALLNVWRKFYLIPRECRKRWFDIVHDLNMIWVHTFDFFRKYKAVVTIFDLTPLIFKKYHWWLNVLWFNLFVKRSAKNADGIVVISKATKSDIIHHFGISPEKIFTTYLWTDVVARKLDSNVGISGPFILSVWTLEPRKNLKNLVKAFAKAKENWMSQDVKLVLTWKIWWKISPFLKELSIDTACSNQIVLTGFLTDEQLAYLYKSCTAFVYPSFYEGFWLPVLEAMAMGAPVITSNVSSMPEVAWDACLLCDPNDILSISGCILEITGNSGLRARLSESGIRRSKLFSWERCARETIDIYVKI